MISRTMLIEACWIAVGILPSLALVLWVIDAEHGLALTSLGSTAILLFCFPTHEGSRPVAVFASHLLGAAIGIALLQIFGSNIWTMGAGVALIAIVMRVCNLMHPPAGANPLIVLNLKSDWLFLVYPLAPALLILMAAVYIWSRLRPGPPWPLRWR
ncbi:MAG TPA: HPP family protein [Ferrovibrio sp.]|uniref:HPP family protein n=1 Tax=Ferrovibrio sp. TaxID=1917215 RepID=UPI002B4B2524|nr:HPP family protein [Ferrovibrio sp.]HLT76931.1 HPP family protein [Ferrovibrio sp.]